MAVVWSAGQYLKAEKSSKRKLKNKLIQKERSEKMYEYFAEVHRIIDGDTFEFKVDVGFHVTILEVFRLRDFDTPETWCPRNDAERRHGKNATKFVKAILKGKIKLQVYRQGYYKRYIADVFTQDSNGRWYSLAEALANAGFEKQPDYPDGEMT